MNEEEKSYLPALRGALSELGLTEQDVDVEHLCGEAWRNHVDPKHAGEGFFPTILSMTMHLSPDFAFSMGGSGGTMSIGVGSLGAGLSSEIAVDLGTDTRPKDPQPLPEPAKVFALHKFKKKR